MAVTRSRTGPSRTRVPVQPHIRIHREERDHVQARGRRRGRGELRRGLPVPDPEEPHEVIWNHKLKYKGIAVHALVEPGGADGIGSVHAWCACATRSLGLYYKPGNTTENINNILIYFFQVVEGPARLAGQVLLVHETLNPTAHRARRGSTTPASAACGARRTSRTTTRARRPTACAPTT